MSHSHFAAVVGVFGTIVLAACGGGSGGAKSDSAATPGDAPAGNRDTAPADRPPPVDGIPIVAPDAGVPPPDAAPPDMGCPDLGTADRPDGALATMLPSLGSLVPAVMAPPTQAVPLNVIGTGFGTDLTVVFGGQRLAGTGSSPLLVTTQVPAAALAQPGQYAVQVESRAGGATTLTNILYFTVAPPAPDAPVLVAYNPDNGVAGDSVVLVGRNLTTEPLMIEGTGGVMAMPGAPGILPWSGEMLQTIAITLPTGWQTGPVTVTNTKGKSRGPIFWAAPNLTRAPIGTPGASSEYGGMWTIPRGADNNLTTSWFTAMTNTALGMFCLGPPFFTVSFADPQAVGHIALRGNREYASGYDFLRGRFEILDAAGAVLFVTSVDLPNPDRDYDLFFAKPLAGARSVRFTSEQDEGVDPGFADLELFAN